MKKVAAVYITYDGLVNSIYGVGVISRFFVNSFKGVRDKLYDEQGVQVDLHLISIALKNGALGYSNKVKKASIQTARMCGGQLHLIVNGTDGTEQFGKVENWKLASAAAANKSMEISTTYDKTIVFCVDIPFMYVPHYIEQQKEAFGAINIESIIVLHSDVLSHEAENPNIERLSWEASAIKYGCLRPSIKFAKTSNFLMNHLIKHYSINKHQIVPLQSGIDLEDSKYKYIDQKKIKKVLETRGIPTNKDLIFSVGRAVPYKGFEQLIEACSKIKHDAHLVFIASPYKFAPSNIEHLKELIKQYKISCTPIYQLDMDLPRFICQWKRTIICAQLSLHEPFGLVPEEVRIWAKNGGPVILTSGREGFVEQITDGIDGFSIKSRDANKIAERIDYIFDLSKKEIARIRQRGYFKAINEYNYQESIYNCLKSIL